MATAAEVPNVFDVVINGNGYILADAPSPDGPEAVYGFTPQFVARQNVQGSYGDNQQDFWMTLSQSDWSLGEQQKYIRVNDPESSRRYWAGTNVDRRTQGQVSIREAVGNSTAAANVAALASGATKVNLATSTNLYELPVAGATPSDWGAHGLGATPSARGLVEDINTFVYLSTTAAGTVGVRKLNPDTSTFSTFSASGADVLAFLNNTLYGLRQNTSSDLVRWDTAGTLTSLFTWKGADAGVAHTGSALKALVPFGGKLAILTYFPAVGGEIWVYDGTSPTVVARFPKTFIPTGMTEAAGSLFVCGTIIGTTGGSSNFGAIYYYASGAQGLLWRGEAGTSPVPSVEAFNNSLVFRVTTGPRLVQYDLTTGGVVSIAASNNLSTLSGSCPSFVAFATTTSTSVDAFPSTTPATTATLSTSLFDGESSLTKYFKSVKIDADITAPATIDLSYRLNDVDGSYTSLQTGAVAGTEYTVGQSGRSLSVKVTLNKGASGNGPVLKRVFVRAAPVQDQFRKETYVLDCTGRDGTGMVQLRNGELHPLDGKEQATNLRTAAMSTTPITVTDEFGTYTGLVDLDGFELRRVGLEQYHAIVPIRQV